MHFRLSIKALLNLFLFFKLHAPSSAALPTISYRDQNLFQTLCTIYTFCNLSKLNRLDSISAIEPFTKSSCHTMRTSSEIFNNFFFFEASTIYIVYMILYKCLLLCISNLPAKMTWNMHGWCCMPTSFCPQHDKVPKSCKWIIQKGVKCYTRKISFCRKIKNRTEFLNYSKTKRISL